MTKAGGRFSEYAMTQAMHEVARVIGADIAGAKLLCLTNNAVFALPAAGVVIRILRSHRLYERVEKIVKLGRWFAEIDAPTIRLAEPYDQPIVIGDLHATVWCYLPERGEALTPTDLGHALRQFHDLGQPPFELPRWDPVGDARARISDAELSERDRDLLLAWCDHLDPRVHALREEAGMRLIHGDAHLGNLLRDANDEVAFCDFDAMCMGPWQVDLAAAPVGEVRFGRRGVYAQLAASYDHDVVVDPNWPTLRDARELKMVVAAAPLLSSSPRVAAEFYRRLASILDGDRHASWTPFADLR